MWHIVPTTERRLEVYPQQILAIGSKYKLNDTKINRSQSYMVVR